MPSNHTVAVVALWIGVVCACGVSVHAQTETDPAATARMHLGPLALTPAISLQDVGYDSNVFNDVENPKHDFTATIRPQVDAWLHLGRARVSLDGSVEGVFFKEYSSERAINANTGATVDVRWNRVSAFVGGTFLTTRDRFGFEIDQRIRRVEETLTVGSNVRLSGKTSVGVRAARRTTDFAEDASAFNASLREALNRHEDMVTASLEHSLTPLTTLVLSTEVQRDSFDLSPERDTRSVRITPGVRFKPSALVSGTAFVGFRKFDPLDPTSPTFSGTYAAVDLSYTLRRMTRFTVQSQRDVQYSLESTQPYYVSTGVAGSVTQAVSRSWGVTARVGTQQLDYRARSTSTDNGSRADRVNLFGTGILCRVSPILQLGVNGDFVQRRSVVQLRVYEGLRIGSFITYGLGGRR